MKNTQEISFLIITCIQIPKIVTEKKEKFTPQALLEAAHRGVCPTTTNDPDLQDRNHHSISSLEQPDNFFSLTRMDGKNL